MHGSSPRLLESLQLPESRWCNRKVSDRCRPAARLQQIGDGLQAGLIENARQHAAVAFDRGAVYEVRIPAREENATATPLGGLARAAQRDGGKVPFARRIVLGQPKRPEVLG